jgi:hypothetical protein
MKQSEQIQRIKQANATGFINHCIVAGGMNAKQATEAFKRSDDKATRLMQKGARISEAILAAV